MKLSAAEIAYEALRQVGSFSPLDTAPTPEEANIALRRLSLLIDFIVAVDKIEYFRVESATFELEADKQTAYTISALVDTSLQFITQVFLVDSEGNRELVTQLRKDMFDQEREKPDTVGEPTICYVSVGTSPTIQFFPTIDSGGYEIELHGFSFSSDITTQGGSVDHGFSAGWQLMLINLLAADLGSGPITTLPIQERNEMRNIGNSMKFELMNSANKEQVSQPRATKMRVL